jgi:hypothetical protein
VQVVFGVAESSRIATIRQAHQRVTSAHGASTLQRARKQPSKDQCIPSLV